MDKRAQQNKHLFIGVFLVLCGILIAVFVYRYRINHSDTILRSTETNTAKSFRYHVKQNTTNDQAGKDFQPGYYDVRVTQGSIHVGGYMGKNQISQNVLYERGNHLNFTGTGWVKLTPAKFEPLRFSAGRAILKDTFGSYLVGNELPAGKYQLVWSTKSKRKGNLQITIQKDDRVQRSMDLKRAVTKRVHLTKGELFEINPPVTKAVAPIRLVITKL